MLNLVKINYVVIFAFNRRSVIYLYNPRLLKLTCSMDVCVCVCLCARVRACNDEYLMSRVSLHTPLRSWHHVDTRDNFCIIHEVNRSSNQIPLIQPLVHPSFDSASRFFSASLSFLGAYCIKYWVVWIRWKLVGNRQRKAYIKQDLIKKYPVLLSLWCNSISFLGAKLEMYCLSFLLNMLDISNLGIFNLWTRHHQYKATVHLPFINLLYVFSFLFLQTLKLKEDRRK